MEPEGLAGVARMGVEGRNGLKRKRGWSDGGGLPVLPDAKGFFGDTEVRRGFFPGEMIDLEGAILARDGVIGCRTRPESMPRTSTVDVEDETVLAVDVSDTLRGSSPRTFGCIGGANAAAHSGEGTIEVTEAGILGLAESALVIGDSPACVVLGSSAIVNEERTMATSSGNCPSISLVGGGGTANSAVHLFSLTDSSTSDGFAVGIAARGSVGSSVLWPSLTMPEISIPELLGMLLSHN
jgi:hypothetical protein